MINYLLDTLTQFGKNRDKSNVDNDNVVTEKTCISCRIISGAGLCGGGAYVAYEAMKRKSPVQKYIMFGVASGFLALGVARTLNLPPFPYSAKAT